MISAMARDYISISSGVRFRGQLTVDELGLVALDGADGQFTIRGLGGAVSPRQVIDNEAVYLVAGDVLESGLDAANVLNVVTTFSSATSAQPILQLLQPGGHELTPT